MKLYSILPFALRRMYLKEVSKGSPLSSDGKRYLEAYECWMIHQKYCDILMQESINDSEIDKAMDLCLNWREKMKQLYPTVFLENVVNFHAVLHIFDDAKIYGPPILFWARPYEHKHKVMRSFIMRSNKHQDEKWAAQQEKVTQHIHFMFPGLNAKITDGPAIKVGDVILYSPNESSDSSHRQETGNTLGCICQVGHDHVVVQQYNFHKTNGKDETLGCWFVGPSNSSSLDLIPPQLSSPIEIKKFKILEILPIVDGFIDRYCILNLSRVNFGVMNK